MALMPKPILVRCEGSNEAGNMITVQQVKVRTCAMCGGWYPGADEVPGHKRKDILAMIDRGDFG